MRKLLLGALLIASSCFASVTVQLTSPTASSTSPVSVKASASSSYAIAGWQIYLDSKSVYSAGATKSISASVATSTGTHTLVVRAWDSTGAYGDQTIKTTVGTTSTSTTSTGTTTTGPLTVSVASPTAYSTVSSPIALSASATGSHPVVGWHVYVDGKDTYVGGTTNSISTALSATQGTHTLVVRAWDNTGAYADKTLQTTVGTTTSSSSSSTGPLTVSVASPTAYSTVSSPITLSASATGSHPVGGWHVYVDGKDSYAGGATNSISTALSATQGTHTLVVRAWDNTGAYADKTLQATVGSTTSSTPTTTPSATTTLAAEIGNNTSASSSFAGWSNGNIAPSNVSKVDVHKLLYSGSTTKIYAHMMPWFGNSSHKSVGYTSWDATQVAKQINDMISRGINGMIIDWYGPSHTTSNTATQLIYQEAIKHPGFEVAIMVDKGAVSGDATTSVVNLLNYVRTNFQTSSAYMRKSSRPVVLFFGVESLSVNWSTVQASVSGNPIYVFENASGFTRAASNGAFSWVGSFGDPNNWGKSYLDGFYNTSFSHLNEHTFGSTKKGFNDNMASWGANRVINQNCGATWVNTFKELGNFFSSTQQLESLQLVTWNDYEEGTEIETGIDNCMSVPQPTVNGSTLSWGVSLKSSLANMNTVDHFTVYSTTDGSNLAVVADNIPNTTRSLNLSNYKVPAGSKYYVKAVGVSSVVNHMSPVSN